MILNPTLPAREQIAAFEGEFFIDLRGEAMGDKAAATAYIRWLLMQTDKNLTVIEAENGRTPFKLSQYFKRDRVGYIELGVNDSFDGLDLYTGPGQDLQCVWHFNAYLAAIGIRPQLDVHAEKSNRIVFAIRTGATYAQRRNMDLACARETIDALRIEGYTVDVLYDRNDPGFPDALNLSLEEAIKHIAGASVFIGGDTGFSHIAAGLDVPVVAIYPDYLRFSKSNQTAQQAASDWWGIPEMKWTPLSCLPNAERLYITELGTDHRWSIGDVIKGVKKLQ